MIYLKFTPEKDLRYKMILPTTLKPLVTTKPIFTDKEKVEAINYFNRRIVQTGHTWFKRGNDWFIKCLVTTGEFSVKCWDKPQYKNKCLCCQGVIKC